MAEYNFQISAGLQFNNNQWISPDHLLVYTDNGGIDLYGRLVFPSSYYLNIGDVVTFTGALTLIDQSCKAVFSLIDGESGKLISKPIVIDNWGERTQYNRIQFGLELPCKDHIILQITYTGGIILIS